ncbi:acyl carrier protein [Micromonospora sp. NPDC048170]|uniref:acyl carrier protein n=1 Tax=Micromonospora sp. NPDC048170 TaxID=3154819 RepID=UPI0034070D12
MTEQLTLDKIVEIARQVIDDPSVGPQDNFFEAGGDSLDVLELCTQIENATGVEIPMEAVWDAENFESLAAALAERLPAPLSQ